MILKWTDEQKQWCIENYRLFSRKQLTVEFNKFFEEDRPESKIISFLKRNKINSGRTGHFSKGGKSWNKGTKGVCKGSSTSFKKGRVPHNYAPIGSERLSGGYVEVKTGEPNKWTQKARLVYESIHGPILPNHKVRFRNGDPADFEPDNLFLVNESEHLNLNKLGFKNHPDENKDTLILIAKLRAKTSDVMERS